MNMRIYQILHSNANMLAVPMHFLFTRLCAMGSLKPDKEAQSEFGDDLLPWR